MDIYEPTKAALEAVLPHPTRALDEVIGKGKYLIQRSPLQPIPGYLVID